MLIQNLKTFKSFCLKLFSAKAQPQPLLKDHFTSEQIATSAGELSDGLTDDPFDPRIAAGRKPEGQHDIYLVLSEEERSKGFIRPLRRSYIHNKCGKETKMGLALCATYARMPTFYNSTFCATCNGHYPVGQFVWAEDREVVGS
jgi:hypothetical protein